MPILCAIALQKYFFSISYNEYDGFSFFFQGIGPPPVVNDFSMPPGLMGGGSGEPERKRPNMDLINSINASILGKSQASSGMASNSAESREERRRKRKSRWGGDESTEKTFIPGMPTMMPQGLSKDQEEAYLRKSLDIFLA